MPHFEIKSCKQLYKTTAHRLSYIGDKGLCKKQTIIEKTNPELTQLFYGNKQKRIKSETLPPQKKANKNKNKKNNELKKGIFYPINQIFVCSIFNVVIEYTPTLLHEYKKQKEGDNNIDISSFNSLAVVFGLIFFDFISNAIHRFIQTSLDLVELLHYKAKLSKHVVEIRIHIDHPVS